MDCVFGFPNIIRFSWKTAQKLLDEHTVPVQFVELMDERDEAVAFRRRAKLWAERQQFFAENDMERVADF